MFTDMGTTHACSCVHTHSHQILCSLAGANVGEKEDKIKNLQKVEFLTRNSAQKVFQEQLDEVIAIQHPAGGKPQHARGFILQLAV